ncbi:MAG: PorV/PorQ family protein [Bacteroidota bacterium]
MLLLLISLPEVVAQERRGTAGSTQELIPLTAQTAALGTALTSGVARASGLELLYSNPAGLSMNQGTGVIYSRLEYVADIGTNYFGFAQRLGNNNVAFTLSSWDFGDIALSTEVNPESDVTWTANFITVGAAFSREFTDRIAAGVTAKFLNERIDDVASTGVLFDAGMTYIVGESGLRFGVSLKNIGPSKTFSGTGLVRFEQLSDQIPEAQAQALSLEGADYESPALLNFGVAYTRELNASTSVSVLGNFRSNSFTQDNYIGALEVGLLDVLYLRGGFQMQENMDQTFYTGANFGAGLNLDLGGNAIQIDYAYRATDVFDGVQLITASVSL